MSNSAFTPAVLTVAGSAAATSGEKNYILSPDDNTASRWVSSDVSKITIATSSSTIPDNITKTTSLAFTRVSGTDGYARYRFTLDQADYGKKFKISWDQIYATAAHWTLEVYSNTSAAYTGTSTKLTVATSAVPGITGTFTTSVDMPGSAAPYIEVRLIGSSASATTIYLNNVLVGPGTIVQGAAISEWQNESSPSSRFSGLNSLANSSPYYRWRRNGSNIEILAGFTLASTDDVTGELAVTLPTGYSINTALLVSSIGSCGEAFAVVAGSNYNATAVSTSSGFVFKGHAASSNWNATVPANWASGNIFHTRIEAPVNEFSGSGTVNLGPGSQVEYAATSGTWDADSSTTVYGPGGVALGGALSAQRTKTITFQYPIQSDDQIFLEFSTDGSKWLPQSSATLQSVSIPPLVGLTGAGPAGVGANCIITGNTTVQVIFGRYQIARMDDGTNAANWPSSNAYWRVRKAKASAPVGFGLVTANDSGLLRSYSAMTKIRLHTGNGYGSTNNKIRRFSTTVVNTGTGVTYADSATLGASFTITEAGIYAIHYADCFSTGSGFGLSLNSSQLTTSIASITTSDRLILGSTSGTSAAAVASITLALSVGDIVRPHTAGDTESGAPDRVSFTIQRVG